MSKLAVRGLSWQRDIPDHRDYTPEVDKVAEMLAGLKPYKGHRERVDWHEYCDEAVDQQDLPTSAAHACAALLQYFERRATGRLIEPSRLFIHTVTQRLLRAHAGGGAGLRATLKAITRCGVPSEDCWPYDVEKCGQPPDPFAYSFSQGYDSLCYVRLDGRGKSGDAVLETVRSYLRAGFAAVCGFPVLNSVSTRAEIPYPTDFDRIRGGHAVAVVGYHDNFKYRSIKGALLIRNSWGQRWGKQGFGWLPYRYVQERLATDFWTLLRPEWLDSGEFRKPN